MKRKIILDCDPGHDDAIAILLAGSSNLLDVLGITIVAGNQELHKTAQNALNVVQQLGLPYKVYAGSSEPILRKQQIAAEIHGESGLDGPVFEDFEAEIEAQHAVNFIVETVKASEEKVTLVATGPLTNLALAMKMDPSIKENIEEIVIMGGTYQLGNMTPAAEFNILVDPEAASIVFSSGITVSMMGLDVSRKVLADAAIVKRMEKYDNVASRLFVDLMTFFNKMQKEIFGWEGGPLHDPITIAYLIDPSVVTTRFMNVQVDTTGGISYGRTNCDYFGMFPDLPKNGNVAIDIDQAKFWDIIEAGIKAYDQ